MSSENIQLDLFETSEQESNLTSRQWSLYRLIRHNSLVEHRKTTKREIYENVRGYEWNDDEKAHDECSAIWKDVKDNNLSLEHEHIIISKNGEYWLGSEEENKKFLQDLWGAISPRLYRYWNYVKKIQKHAQGKLLDKNNNPIVEDNAPNRFFQAFNEYDITMQREVKQHE